MIDSTYNPAPGGMLGMNVPCTHAGGIVKGQRRTDKDGEPHDANQCLHHFLEAAVSAKQHEDESEQAVKNASPRLRDPSAGEIGDAKPGRIRQRRADEDRPQHEIHAEIPLDPCRQVLRPSLQCGFSRCELPPRDALVQDEFEERADRDRPEQHHPVARAADGRGDDVTRPDPGSGNDKPGACELQELV